MDSLLAVELNKIKENAEIRKNWNSFEFYLGQAID